MCGTDRIEEYRERENTRNTRTVATIAQTNTKQNFFCTKKDEVENEAKDREKQ